MSSTIKSIQNNRSKLQNSDHKNEVQSLEKSAQRFINKNKSWTADQNQTSPASQKKIIQKSNLSPSHSTYDKNGKRISPNNNHHETDLAEETAPEKNLADSTFIEQNQTTSENPLDRPETVENEDSSTAITTKENDSFYSVVDRKNIFSEDQSGYTIDAYSPLEEKDNIRISINNNKAVISGSRKTENKFEDTNRLMTNNNFQTFREEFSFDSSIAPEGMTRERQGDYIRIFIPKSQQK